MKVMKNKNQNNHHESLCEFCICKHLKQMIVFFQYFDEIILVHLVTISYATQPTVDLKDRENLLIMMKMHLIKNAPDYQSNDLTLCKVYNLEVETRLTTRGPALWQTSESRNTQYRNAVWWVYHSLAGSSHTVLSTRSPAKDDRHYWVQSLEVKRAL